MPTASKKTTVARKDPVKKGAKAAPTSKEARGGPDIGERAPPFSLPATQIGKAASVAFKGKPYVLFFYPKDDTSGCTAEACGFRDALPAFSKLGLTVIGVSKDSLESHEKFTKKYSLTFPLASDKECDLSEKFGVW